MYKFDADFLLSKLYGHGRAEKPEPLRQSGKLVSSLNEEFWVRRNNPGNRIPAWDTYRQFSEEAHPLVGTNLSPLLGIEIEAEYVSNNWANYKIPEWTWYHDGSLRNNGVEFISEPLYPSEARKALCGLWAQFKTWQPKRPPRFGWRTSIHVHMNMLDQTAQHLVKMLLCYMVFEESLFEFAGPTRKDSIFCVPLTRSAFYKSFQHFWRGNHVIELLNGMDRYSALNLLPLRKLGTIEFRALEGTNDLNRIIDWIGILVKLDEYCQKSNLDEIIATILQMNTISNYDAFKLEVFGPKYAELVDARQSQPHMSECVKYVKECLSEDIKSPYTPEHSGLVDHYTTLTKHFKNIREDSFVDVINDPPAAPRAR